RVHVVVGAGAVAARGEVGEGGRAEQGVAQAQVGPRILLHAGDDDDGPVLARGGGGRVEGDGLGAVGPGGEGVGGEVLAGEVVDEGPRARPRAAVDELFGD